LKIKNIDFGSREIIIIAGPCSVESREQLLETTKDFVGSGVKILRGGTFKSRTSPNSFMGLKEKGLKLLKEAGEKLNMVTITEVMSQEQLEIALNYVDIIQVGSRSMHNYPLLTALGKLKVPVLLKRGFGSNIEEWINASRYIQNEGNPNIILCERGIRTFEHATRFTLDLSSIPIIKNRTGLPIIVDPSHAAGDSELIIPLAKAAVAVGADGLMIEVHFDPDSALSDGKQSLTPKQLKKLIDECKKVALAVDRVIDPQDKT
jgi:3-deoxy-7-phosphoheptulonate synthase